ncbi:MAG: transposase [Methanosarcina sp.]
MSSIERHLPPYKSNTGRPRSDLRKLMNGIFYVINTGCTWGDVLRNSAEKGETSVTMATRK